ncbi:MAG TPA: long-chain fatty acid--CoA ligase, partial [Anaerolineae bacterium]|nr:long-chain fatty acid--CoA ligase [Anaerolineae bacterium]
MQDWLTARANASPDALALMIGEERWTYGELDGLVNGVYGRLQQTGVQPGDYVAVLLPNNLAYVCLIHALARLGAVLVPLNIRLTPTELQWQNKYAGCDWLLYNEETADKWLMGKDRW